MSGQSSLLLAAIVLGSLVVVLAAAFDLVPSATFNEFVALAVIALCLFHSPMQFIWGWLARRLRRRLKPRGPFPPPEGAVVGIPHGPRKPTPQAAHARAAVDGEA
jgi:hypothetical protein